MVVDKATQYAASTAAKKGTSNKQIVYNYMMNMQGLMSFSNFFDTERDYETDPNLTPEQNKENTIRNSSMDELELVNSREDPSERKRVDGALVVTPSVFQVSHESEGNILNQLVIVPGVVTDRYSGSWVSVSAKHEYKILTPLLQAVLGGSCDTGGNTGVFIDICNYFPISKTTVYRVE